MLKSGWSFVKVFWGFAGSDIMRKRGKKDAKAVERSYGLELARGGVGWG